MIHKAENYYTVKDYAKMCGVSVRNVRDRIRAKSIHYRKIESFYFINPIISPPVSRINPNRPVRGNGLQASSFDFNGLREVGCLSKGNHFSEGIIYEAIITGKVDGYIIGDKVFVKPEEAKEVYRKR